MSFRPFRALAAATASMAIFALAPAALAGTPGVHQITGAKLAKALLPASSFGRGTPTAAKPNLTALAARLISRVSALH